MSTFATLLFVPSIFAIVIGKQTPRSPSIYPFDPESSHFDPHAQAGEGHGGGTAASDASLLNRGEKDVDPDAGAAPGTSPEAAT
jgi:hypothetical protein